MEINYAAVLVAAVAQFIFGAIWYMPLFGNLWGKMHGFEKNSPEAQEAMKKGMFPLLSTQFAFTIVTSVVFAFLVSRIQTDLSIYVLAVLFWLGFIVPTQISAVLFGGTDPKWVVKKILVMAFGALGCLLLLALVLNLL